MRAGRAERLRIERDCPYRYCYLFAAACTGRPPAAGPVTPKAGTEWMNEHLAATGAAVSEGSIGVAVLDGAGSHGIGDLIVPEGLRLPVLPPDSPGLNPMEQVFKYLKAHRFASRVLPDVAKVQDACERARKWLRPTPERIASILHREWVTAAAC